jgi:hypothetical protein
VQLAELNRWSSPSGISDPSDSWFAGPPSEPCSDPSPGAGGYDALIGDENVHRRSEVVAVSPATRILGQSASSVLDLASSGPSA